MPRDPKNVEKKIIEDFFPIEKVNQIAERESSIASKYYRPSLKPFHKWWARRLGCVFRAILLYSLIEKGKTSFQVDGLTRYSGIQTLLHGDSFWNLFKEDVEIDATILDPMMGGGTTILEALKLGCNVIGVDLNPVASFIVRKMVEPVDTDRLLLKFQEIEKKIGSRIRRYYETTCPVCGMTADGVYYFWVKQLKCMGCSKDVDLFGDYMIASAKSPKESQYYVYCPSCEAIFTVSDYRKKQICPNCKNEFDPTKGNAAGTQYTCPHCDQMYNIVESIGRHGKPKEKLFAIKYFCENCNTTGFKAPDDNDSLLIAKAREEYANLGDELIGKYVPNQKIPIGQETHPRLKNHGYVYFRDMFNRRQLLNLSTLLKEILSIDDENIRELLLLSFSEHLKFNNMFCRYNRSKNQLSDIFRGHHFHPQNIPVESSVWGTEKGSSFRNTFRKIFQGKKYFEQPFEKFMEKGKAKTTKLKKIRVRLIDERQAVGKDGNALILCRSSDFIPIGSSTVDAVITDPPYYGNVMYSELADFFYVWLRLGLKEKYNWFGAEFSPKNKEIVVNPSRDRDLSPEQRQAKFLNGLTDIYTECHRVMKDEGLLVFTFHHKKPEAWSSVLQAVLDAEFYIVSTYPIHSEMSTSTHIYEKQNISYDTIVVCRKKVRQERKEEMPWKLIEDEVYSKAKEMAKQYVQMDGSRLSLPDMSVVVRGKCLEIFSQHYPNIVKEDGTIMGVHDALEKVTDIVDEHLVDERIREVSSKADKITALYLLLIAGRKDISFDALHRQLQGRGLEPEDFTRRRLLEKKDRLYVVPPEDRASFIEEMSVTERNALDKAHYLHFLSTSRKHSLVDRIEEWIKNDELKEWIDDSVIFVLKELASETGNKEYERIARYAEKHVGKELQWKLPQFLGGE